MAGKSHVLLLFIQFFGGVAGRYFYDVDGTHTTAKMIESMSSGDSGLNLDSDRSFMYALEQLTSPQFPQLLNEIIVPMLCNCRGE